MKWVKVLTIGTVMGGNIWASELYDFQDAQKNKYLLVSTIAEQVLNPQSEFEEVCRAFIENELNNSDAQKMTRLQKTTSMEEETPYFLRFMEKTRKTQNHRLLVLMKRIDSTLEPVGMGKVDLLEEVEAFIPEDTKTDLKERVGSLSRGYCIGGNISQSYQNRGIVSAVSTPLLDIIMHDIYKDRCSRKEPPYMFIQTLLGNLAMNHICVKMGMERITSDEGRKREYPDHLSFSHEYIYRTK